jgi:hypothetical protein
MSDDLYSGWGVRTLGAREPAVTDAHVDGELDVSHRNEFPGPGLTPPANGLLTTST